MSTFCQQSHSLVRRALKSGNHSHLCGREFEPSLGRKLYKKNVRFFLLIEKTLGNVSPCLELALSQSFNGTWE